MPTVNPGFYAQMPPNQSSVEKFLSALIIRYLAKDYYKVKLNAVGSDDVSQRFLKILLPWVIHSIKYLYNTIITTNTFPMEWKYAKIIPVPKTGIEYRTISILPYLSKVFERLIYKQMIEFINQYNLLSDRQSGFSPRYSFLTAVTDVIVDIRSSVDDGRITFLVLFDHSKTFDTVQHSIMYFKLFRMFNFSTNAVRLMFRYVFN